MDLLAEPTAEEPGMQGVAGDASASTPGLAPPASPTAAAPQPAPGEGEGGSAAGFANLNLDASGRCQLGEQV